MRRSRAIRREPVRTESIWGLVGGAIVGYIAWLVAISIGAAVSTESRWSLVVLALSGLLAIWAVLWGSRLRRRRNYALAAFAFALPILPVALSLAVLAATYS
ncbi:hypothetical protein AWC26_07475 [Mycobacterium shimoidei]|uniref:Uncharacterized protein n=1 Tax=Mycobacterium shimoidei TaxID=29313 RepID=A0A1E3TC76_MYCSH|nr:hypothetical protein [Mycobacterium shimoidei]ODR11994.1 hypothetical protein BHQ16_18065 [Mycobacterium shimoidei]ORW81480.1 hypothetical protein AWC26_07475 [Mycobacterium shimoidei]SRX92317.1 hypothetical protein MSP7336_00542 [Mycobacterium shimoidei]